MNWLNKVLDIGKVREGKKINLTFVATPVIPEVINILVSCGCVNPLFDEKTRLLNVTYKAGKIPKQVTGNAQTIRQTITVVYKDGTIEELFIKGIKIRG